MAPIDTIWPTLDALDACWISDEGLKIEQAKARCVEKALSKGVPGRPKVLIIGPMSEPLMHAISSAKPALIFQAYPPAIGVRAGGVPTLMMDTDLPPFQRGTFDLVVISHALEYRSFPLAFLSLAYEILQPQGCLLTLVPHVAGAEASRPGQGRGFWDFQVRILLRQSAFTVRESGCIRQNRWRPTSLIHLSQPQVPPCPSGRMPVLPRLEEFWRARRVPGIAASGQTRVGRRHD